MEIYQELFIWSLLDLKLITGYNQAKLSHEEQNSVAGFKVI